MALKDFMIKKFPTTVFKKWIPHVKIKYKVNDVRIGVIIKPHSPSPSQDEIMKNYFNSFPSLKTIYIILKKIISQNEKLREEFSR